MCIFIQRMKDFSICITMDGWKLARGGLFQDTEEEEESVITYPHLRILLITSAHNPRNISPQFTRLNIRTSAFYRRPSITPPTCSPSVAGLGATSLTTCRPNCCALPTRSRLLIIRGGRFRSVLPSFAVTRHPIKWLQAYCHI